DVRRGDVVHARHRPTTSTWKGARALAGDRCGPTGTLLRRGQPIAASGATRPGLPWPMSPSVGDVERACPPEDVVGHLRRVEVRPREVLDHPRGRDPLARAAGEEATGDDAAGAPLPAAGEDLLEVDDALVPAENPGGELHPVTEPQRAAVGHRRRGDDGVPALLREPGKTPDVGDVVAPPDVHH